MKARKAQGYIYLNISSLFFHVVYKLVQAPVIMYNEVFQALAVKDDDVLLPKLFWDLSFDDVIRWKSPAWYMLFQSVKHTKAHGGQVTAVWWWPRTINGFGSTISSTAKALKISTYITST
jgi:hypothetical protein